MDKKILIIPDTHLRDYLLNPIIDKINEVDKIIFLGDYLDPYPKEGISNDPIQFLKKIIDLKKNNMNKVVLLLGNHDVHYIDFLGNDIIPCCRFDETNFKEIKSLFTENKNLFQLIYKLDNIIFSHSGIMKEWVDNYCNCSLEELLDDERKAYNNLWVISWIRGGYEDYGSCIWNDVRDFHNSYFPNYYQCFGHTLLYRPLIREDYACLDCKKDFILNLETKKFEEI